jgi:hypothetical protein
VIGELHRRHRAKEFVDILSAAVGWRWKCFKTLGATS